MSDQLTRDVWAGVKQQILKKNLLRRNAQMRLRLHRDAKLGNGQVILGVEFSYDLYNLSDHRYKTQVQHELDYQLEAPALSLPRFERVMHYSNGAPQISYEGEGLARHVKQGVVTFDVDLEPRGGSHEYILTKRTEIAFAPGSYNFYMGEYTQGLQVQIDECPNDIAVDVWVRPEGNARSPQKEGQVWHLESIILPGQGVEIKFERRAN